MSEKVAFYRVGPFTVGIEFHDDGLPMDIHCDCADDYRSDIWQEGRSLFGKYEEDMSDNLCPHKVAALSAAYADSVPEEFEVKAI
jgi:hypothetical protein